MTTTAKHCERRGYQTNGKGQVVCAHYRKRCRKCELLLCRFCMGLDTYQRAFNLRWVCLKCCKSHDIVIDGAARRVNESFHDTVAYVCGIRVYGRIFKAGAGREKRKRRTGRRRWSSHDTDTQYHGGNYQ